MDDADGPVANIADVFILDDTFVGVVSRFEVGITGVCCHRVIRPLIVGSVSSFWADSGPHVGRHCNEMRRETDVRHYRYRLKYEGN